MKDNYKKFIDPNIKRKSHIIQNSLQFDRSNKVPLFSLVEISDSGTCNRACSFCPRSNKDWIDKFDKKEFIQSELHESIVSQLKDLDYKKECILYLCRIALLGKILSTLNHLE